MIMQCLGILCLGVGVIFQIIGSIGIVRFPDFFSRVHAASKPETLGLGMSIIGIALYHGMTHVGLKLFLIAVFIFVANPAAAHALGRSALRMGLKPWTKDQHQES